MMCLIEGSDKYILVGQQCVTTYNTGSTEAVVKYVVYRLLAITAILFCWIMTKGRPNGQAYQARELNLTESLKRFANNNVIPQSDQTVETLVAN